MTTSCKASKSNDDHCPHPPKQSGNHAAATNRAALADGPIIKTRTYLQHDILAVNVRIGERAGDDGGALVAEVVGVEDDVVAVAVFESL